MLKASEQITKPLSIASVKFSNQLPSIFAEKCVTIIDLGILSLKLLISMRTFGIIFLVLLSLKANAQNLSQLQLAVIDTFSWKSFNSGGSLTLNREGSFICEEYQIDCEGNGSRSTIQGSYAFIKENIVELSSERQKSETWDCSHQEKRRKASRETRKKNRDQSWKHFEKMAYQQQQFLILPYRSNLFLVATPQPNDSRRDPQQFPVFAPGYHQFANAVNASDLGPIWSRIAHSISPNDTNIWNVAPPELAEIVEPCLKGYISKIDQSQSTIMAEVLISPHGFARENQILYAVSESNEVLTFEVIRSERGSCTVRLLSGTGDQLFLDMVLRSKVKHK